MKKKLNVIVDIQNYFMLQGVIQMLDNYQQKEINITPVQSDKDLILLISTNKYDLVISNTDNDDFNPVDIFHQVRKNGLQTPVLFISDCKDERLLRDICNLGHTGIIHHNCREEEFNKAILTLLKGQDYYANEVAIILMKGVKFQTSKIDRTTLTNREKEVLRLSSYEYSNQEIAERLNISMRTVEGHKLKIKAKLKSKTWAGAIHSAYKQGLIA